MFTRKNTVIKLSSVLAEIRAESALIPDEARSSFDTIHDSLLDSFISDLTEYVEFFDGVDEDVVDSRNLCVRVVINKGLDLTLYSTTGFNNELNQLFKFYESVNRALSSLNPEEHDVSFLTFLAPSAGQNLVPNKEGVLIADTFQTISTLEEVSCRPFVMTGIKSADSPTAATNGLSGHNVSLVVVSKEWARSLKDYVSFFSPRIRGAADYRAQPVYDGNLVEIDLSAFAGLSSSGDTITGEPDYLKGGIDLNTFYKAFASYYGVLARTHVKRNQSSKEYVAYKAAQLLGIIIGELHDSGEAKVSVGNVPPRYRSLVMSTISVELSKRSHIYDYEHQDGVFYVWVKHR